MTSHVGPISNLKIFTFWLPARQDSQHGDLWASVISGIKWMPYIFVKGCSNFWLGLKHFGQTLRLKTNKAKHRSHKSQERYRAAGARVEGIWSGLGRRLEQSRLGNKRAGVSHGAAWMHAKADWLLPGVTVSYQRILHEVYDEVRWQLRWQIFLRGNGIPPETPVCSLQRPASQNMGHFIWLWANVCWAPTVC